MNTFNKKSLYAALAGISALGVTGAAEAVSVNPDGLGQALIYPYYTVRDRVALAGYNTLLSVVNSTASAKAVKVRFLEGKNSREVLDFNLYLSAKDVWVAAVIPTAAGAGIYTPDKSCTQPTVSSSPSSPTPFVNFAYTGSAADGADTSLDRTREGYIEIIEMGDIYTGSTTYDAITHVAGVPDCAPLTSASADTVAGSGGLFGTRHADQRAVGRCLRRRRDRAGRLLDDPAVVCSGLDPAEPGQRQPEGLGRHRQEHDVRDRLRRHDEPDRRCLGRAHAQRRAQRVRARHHGQGRRPTGSSRCRRSTRTSRRARATTPAACSSATSTATRVRAMT